MQLVQTQGTDDGHGGLRTTVTAGIHQHGDKGGQHREQAQGILKRGNDHPRKGSGDHQKHQPRDPVLEQVEGRTLEVGLFRRGHSGHDFHVLGGRVLHDVHGVVEGDDTHHPVLPVHHGQGYEVIFGKGRRHFFLIGLGSDRDQVRFHDVFDLGLVIGGQQKILYRHKTDERPVLFRNVAGVNGLLIHALTSDAENGLLHGHVGAQGNVFRGHDGTGGIFGVTQNLIDRAAHFRVGVL